MHDEILKNHWLYHIYNLIEIFILKLVNSGENLKIITYQDTN